jgi:hypothetical protein
MDPGSEMETIRIRDLGWKKSDPGSGINIPDPQHWTGVYFFLRHLVELGIDFFLIPIIDNPIVGSLSPIIDSLIVFRRQCSDGLFDYNQIVSKTGGFANR